MTLHPVCYTLLNLIFTFSQFLQRLNLKETRGAKPPNLKMFFLVFCFFWWFSDKILGLLLNVYRRKTKQRFGLLRHTERYFIAVRCVSVNKPHRRFDIIQIRHTVVNHWQIWLRWFTVNFMSSKQKQHTTQYLQYYKQTWTNQNQPRNKSEVYLKNWTFNQTTDSTNISGVNVGFSILEHVFDDDDDDEGPKLSLWIRTRYICNAVPFWLDCSVT